MKKKLILIPLLILVLVVTLAIGCTGNQGPKGDKGDTGDQGSPGIQGEQGEQGLQGEVGLQGVVGARGSTGAKGANGLAGTTGEQGIQGEQGPVGVGYLGVTGATGATGADGPQGLQGEPGVVSGVVVSYTTIQDAIDVASPGATITVPAGTYVEDLVIPEGKDNLELVGAEGAIIKGVANVPIALWPLGAPNIEILADGVKIHGFTIQGPDYAAGYYASGIILDGTGIEIYDNDFVTTPAETAGELAHAITTISKTVFPTADVSGLYIHDNTFTGSGAAGSEFIYINPHTGTGTITIDSNQFSGSTNIGITAESGNVVVSNNTISTTLGTETAPYGTYGMRFMDTLYGANGNYDNIVVSGNDISGFKRAIRVGNGSNPDTSVFVGTISSNTLTNNVLGVWGRNGNNLTVVNNDIVGNIDGILNGNGDTTITAINAVSNWWGDASGPTHSSNPEGTGDSVSDGVDFNPWLLVW